MAWIGQSAHPHTWDTDGSRRPWCHPSFWDSHTLLGPCVFAPMAISPFRRSISLIWHTRGLFLPYSFLTYSHLYSLTICRLSFAFFPMSLPHILYTLVSLVIMSFSSFHTHFIFIYLFLSPTFLSLGLWVKGAQWSSEGWSSEGWSDAGSSADPPPLRQSATTKASHLHTHQIRPTLSW